MLRHVTLLSRSAPMMRNDQLALLEKLVGNSNTFTQQPARISAQIEDQSLEIAKLIQRFRNFFFRSLVEASDVQVANSRPDQEMHIHTVAGNFVADQGEL